MMVSALSYIPMLLPALDALKWRLAELVFGPERYKKLRFGQITETIKAIEANVVSEIEFRDSKGNVIGYWAHGYYDPQLPYAG